MKKIVNPEIFDEDLNPLGFINAYTALKWNTRYNWCGGFELWCPIIPENVELLQEGNIIWIGGKDAAVITVIDKDNSESKNMNIKGKFIDFQLSYRSMWDVYNGVSKNVSEIIYEVVDSICINPSSQLRVLPKWKIENPRKTLGDKISLQSVGSLVMEFVENVTQSHRLGFRSDFNPYEKEIVFQLYEGQNKSVHQSVNPFVVFEYDTEEILSARYFKNTMEYANVALVAGSDTGVNRKKAYAGDTSLSGLARREIYVDAGSLRETDDSGRTFSAAEYETMLKQEGLQKLSAAAIFESYDAIVKTDGESNYEYGVDYGLGDIVTVSDSYFGISIDTRVMEIEEVFDSANGYTMNLVFGYEQPMLSYKVK